MEISGSWASSTGMRSSKLQIPVRRVKGYEADARFSVVTLGGSQCHWPTMRLEARSDRFRVIFRFATRYADSRDHVDIGDILLRVHRCVPFGPNTGTVHLPDGEPADRLSVASKRTRPGDMGDPRSADAKAFGPRQGSGMLPCRRTLATPGESGPLDRNPP